MRGKANSRVLALLLLLLAAGRLCAQEYSFRVFGNDEGLGNLTVRNLYQDHQGFLWVSTGIGIFRFDGERFEAFGPAQGIPLVDLAAFGDAPDGTLLAGGSFGLYRLLGNRFERLSGPFKTISWRQGIQTDGKGHTFLGTDAGLIEISVEAGQSGFARRWIWRTVGISEAKVYGVLVDGGKIWYGCGQQLCRMGEDGRRVFGLKNGLPESAVLAIRKDHEGNLWVRASDGSVFVLPYGQAKFRRPGSPVSGHPMNALSVDSDGRILLLSPQALLIQGKNGWRKADRASGLHGAPVAVFEDRQHVLWIGTDGRGLIQWRGYQSWESYSAASGLASDVTFGILPHGNLLWVGTMGGLMRGERQPEGIRWSRVPGLEGISVRLVCMASDGALWISAEDRGVARLDQHGGGIKWFGKAQGLLGDTVFALRFDHERRLWVGSDAGLFVAQPPYARFVRAGEAPSSAGELPLSLIRAVAEGSDGTLWAGGAGGLFALAGGRWRNFSRADGLSNQEVISLGAGADGTMWVGYRFGGGIDRVHLQSGALAVEKGLQRPGTDGVVYFLEYDASGRLWAGTEHGVDVWNGRRWSHYDMGDGLVWNDCDVNGFAAEPDGAVWIGTSGGLSRFKPRPQPGAVAPLEVVFTKLVMGQRDVTGQSNPSFKIQENSLTAYYSALNVVRQNSVLFRYRLEGGNSNWTQTAHRGLHFAQLAPGNYRLRVEAQGGEGVWSGHGAEFAFRILPPWYRRWWFYLICGLIPLLAAAAVARSRMAELKRREREVNRLMQAHEEIRNLAFYDPLTGLPNRRLLLDRLRKTLARGSRSERLRAILFADLDDFKTLNDTLGHQTGDLLLQEVARRLVSCVREADTVSRLGGDEFVVMLEELSELPEVAAAQAEVIARKILGAISQPYLLDGRECMSTASIGITVFGSGEESTNEILQQADIAMYEAKGVGRNAVRFFAPALQAAVNARAAMEEDLRLAIKTEQFVLFYQPQVNRGVPFGAEVLVRWNHPARGILLPDEFISLAEETGLILPLGDWILGAACRQIAAWAGRPETAHLALAANISARQFRQPEFVERVSMALNRAGANPKNLMLELTESILVDNVEDVIVKMTELKRLGVKFSLDDFGTGYSSLSYLKRLPLDELKIDQSFVQGALADASGGAIVQAILSLGRALGLPVLAEGVETEKQREFLAGLGCHAYQGFLFSRPLPVEEFERLLAGPAGNADASAG